MQSVLHAADGVMGSADRFVMPCIGEHDRRSVHRLFGDTYQFALERLYLAVLGREGYQTATLTEYRPLTLFADRAQIDLVEHADKAFTPAMV